MSEIIRQVEAAIDQGAHHGEYAERVVSLQFLRRVLAALRVPTIAVTDEMVDAALTEYVGEPPFEDYFGEEVVGPHRLNMRAALEAALATPSPTIAADAVVARLRTEMIAWRDQWVEASRKAGGCGSWDEAAAKLNGWITALATPPTEAGDEEPFITCDDCGAKITDVRDIETTEDRCWHKNCPKGKP